MLFSCVLEAVFDALYLTVFDDANKSFVSSMMKRSWYIDYSLSVAVYAILWGVFVILKVCLSRMGHALYLCYLECACHSVLTRYKAGATFSKVDA